jgi:hypothetical protein
MANSRSASPAAVAAAVLSGDRARGHSRGEVRAGRLRESVGGVRVQFGGDRA